MSYTFHYKNKILINTIVIMELSHYLVKNLGAVKGREKLDSFLSFGFFVDGLDFASSRESIRLLCEYSHAGIGGRDSTILASMRKHKIKTIATHNISFKKVDWLDVLDPAL
ncbi:MAG: type II toxin-antitoxin system VapC family toxin [Candidatus Aenigmarchaeota archaeon]|nr:type II toxin-antitoxin system VapC family toxin [Candidatus Aenigmarchaeota archaeon]